MTQDLHPPIRIRHHTKIVATLGPASNRIDILEKMIRSGGLNVVRFNFSHGTAEFHQKNAEIVRQAAFNCGHEIAIIADLQGPKIRIGKMADEGVEMQAGSLCILDPTYLDEGTAERIGLDYAELPQDVSEGDILLLDDGLLSLKVEKVDGHEIHARVLNTHILKSHKGINKAGGGLSAAALTEKDFQDLQTALEIGCDYVAVSFVKSAEDLNLARDFIRLHANNRPEPGIIAKIERIEAIHHLDEILAACDGIMVARGDLAVEVGYAAVPALQKRMIARARAMRKFSITATQMMESMINNPVPTRAEVSDVANAVLDGTDAVMCSAETAVGAYPFETVSQMAAICAAAEAEQDTLTGLDTTTLVPPVSPEIAVASGAVHVARAVSAKAIVTLTESGRTAFEISRHTICLPIYALTPNVYSQRKMAMYRAVRPLLLHTSCEHDTALQQVETSLLNANILQLGDQYIITSGSHMRRPGSTDMLQVAMVKER